MESPSTKFYRLLSSLRQKSASGQHFVSYIDLKRSVNETLISDVIDEFYYPEHRRSMVVPRILEKGLKLFAILTWMRAEDQMSHFLEHDELDSRLPMEETQVRRIAPKVEDRFWKETQWEFLPYEFGKNDGHCIIHNNVILPFLKEVKLAEGASGEIYESTIALGQQTFLSESSTTPVVVVRKRLKMSFLKEEGDGLLREIECLEILRFLRHSNIIHLLGSYTHRGEHNLLFPLLPQDLAGFLKGEQRFGEFQENLTFCDALSALASAIETVHDLTVNAPDRQKLLRKIGYHHDIRPKNILVNHSTFILADFGLARFKPASEDSKTRWKAGIGDYIAPECMDEYFDHQNVGRSIDIWSFGCLVAEVVTYMEGGPSYVMQFREERERSDLEKNWTEHYFFEKRGLKVAVSRWLKMLSTKTKGREIRCLVEAARVMLQVKHEDRPKIAIISRILSYISIKAAFECTSKTFRRILTSTHYSSHKISPYTRSNISFEAHRYKAWGIVLGMYTDQVDCAVFRDSVSIATSTRSILERLRSTLLSYISLTSEKMVSKKRVSEGLTPSEIMVAYLQDKDERSPFDEDIRKLIQDLWVTVPVVYQERMEQAWRTSVFENVNSKQLDKIEHDGQMLRVADHHRYMGLGVRAAMRKLELALWREGETASPKQKKLILKGSEIERTHHISQHRELGWYRPAQRLLPDENLAVNSRHRVLIEWVLYSPVWDGQSSEEKVLKIVTLAEILHNPKPQGFHVLDCVGVITPTTKSDHEGFGFVYSFPRGNNMDLKEEPINLVNLIQTKDYAMLLEEKFKIATSLARSVYELHSAGWLHKNIQPVNILFFPDGLTNTWKDPFLLGFHHSRPNGEIWYSDTNLHNYPRTDYHHPEYIPSVKRFKNKYDYYSLGVVFLELGFGKSVSSFRARHMEAKAEEFRQLLIERYAPQLGSKMGSIYVNVVIDCLTGQFDKTEEEPGTSSDLVGFYWKVVAKLSKCHVG